MRKTIFKEYTNKTSLDKRYSRITQGGVPDVYANRIGWWERDGNITEKANDDITVTIDHTNVRQPHMIAYQYYGRSDLFWLVLQYNNIVDVNEEMNIGAVITIPSIRRTFYALTLKTPKVDKLYERT